MDDLDAETVSPASSPCVPATCSCSLGACSDCQTNDAVASSSLHYTVVDLPALIDTLGRLTLSPEPSSTCTDLVSYRGDDQRLEDSQVPVGHPLLLCWEADRAWTLRMLKLLLESAKPRMLMAWCSTLGGAHSSLGEELYSHAEQAGVMSQHQLVLASAMGDLNLVSRCKLYAAFSLLQRGQLHRAARIIREQYHYATEEAILRDHHLITMCLAAWIRLQTLLSASTAVSLTGVVDGGRLVVGVGTVEDGCYALEPVPLSTETEEMQVQQS